MLEQIEKEIRASSVTEFEANLDRVVRGVRSIIDAPIIIITFEDSFTRFLRVKRAMIDGKSVKIHLKIPIMDKWGTTTAAFKSGDERVKIFEETDSLSLADQWIATRLKAKSFAIFPIWARRAIGLVCLGSFESGPFLSRELAGRIESFIANTSMILEGGKIYSEQQELSERLLTLSKQLVADNITELSTELFSPVETAAIVLFDDRFEKGTVFSVYSKEEKQIFSELSGTTVRLENSLASVVFEKKEIHHIEDIPFENWDRCPLAIQAKILRLRAMIAIPLSFNDLLLGAILCFLKKGTIVPPSQYSLLPYYAEVFSEILGTSETKERSLSTFIYLDEIISSPNLAVPFIMKKILREGIRYMDADAGVVVLLDAITGRLVIGDSEGYGTDLLSAGEDIPVKLTGRSIVTHVVRTGNPYLASSTLRDTQYFQIDKSIRSELATPLTIKGRITGVFCVSSKKENFFTRQDVERLSFFASNVAWSIDNARIVEKARETEERFIRQEQAIHYGMDEAHHASNLRYHFGNLIGAPDGAMGKVYSRIERLIAMEDDYHTILVTGDTGTGKDVVAFAIHNNGSRRKKSMVVANFAAFGGDPNLIQSELFGHEKGSFTGASERRVGRFEQAHETTLFIDEIGDIVPAVQAKLLRVLQAERVKSFQRLGGNETIESDVRVIAATNKDLRKEVEEGRFREDLYYRLNTLKIRIPPLRDHSEDIPDLVAHFIAKHTTRTAADRRGRPTISRSALKILQAYDWPGNIRQLESVIVSSMILYGDRDTIQQGDVLEALEEEGRDLTPADPAEEMFSSLLGSPAGSFWEDIYPRFLQRDIDRTTLQKLIERALAETGGYYTKVAELFGIEKADYRKFMDFLRNSGCKVDYRPYRMD